MEKDKKAVSLEMINKHIEAKVQEAAVELDTVVKGLSTDFEGFRKGQKQSKDEIAEKFVRVSMAQLDAQRKLFEGKPLVNASLVDETFATIEKRYGNSDPAFVAEVKDLMASGNGGNLVDETWASTFIAQLYDETILTKLGVRFQPSQSGVLSIPKIVEGLAAGYVGEGQTIETSTLKFAHIRLSAKKLMAMTPISNDLIRTASIDVQSLVRAEMSLTMTSAMDNAFLYGKGGEWEPRGIANVEGITKMTAGQAPTRKLGLEMQAELGKRNHSTNDAVWVMGWNTFLALQLEGTDGNFYNMNELGQGKFVGLPYIVTNRVETKGDNEDFFLVKANDITAIQLGGIALEASREASIHTADGILSSFGQDYTLVRGITHHDFGLNYKSSVVLANVKAK